MWNQLQSTSEEIFKIVTHARWARWLALGAVIGIIGTLFIHPVLTRPAPLEDGELVILSGRDESPGGQRQQLIKQWNELHPDNPARIIELPGQADAQHSEMVAQAQSGRDEIDIFNLDVTWTAEFADREFVRPLSEAGLDTSGFLAKPLETCRYDGKLWALPFNSDAGLLYYRTDLVPSAPGSWPQVRADIERVLAQPHPPELVAGYGGQLANYEGLTVNALEAMWSAGADVVDRDGDVVIGGFLQEANDGLGRLRPNTSNPQLVLPESLRHDEISSMQAFRGGKVIFMRNWPLVHRLLDPPVADGAPGPKIAFGVAPLPGSSVLGGQNLAISAHSGQPRAAQALIEFLTDPRSQQILFERGGFAATREVVYHDEAVIRRYKYATVLLAAINDARLRPVTRHYDRFSETFRKAVDDALRNNKPLPNDLADRLEEALRGR